MTYRHMPRANYFTYIMVLNAIVTVFNAIGLMGIMDKDPFLIFLGVAGILVFFGTLYMVFKSVVKLEKSRDEILVANIKKKYMFSSVEIGETDIQDRIAYGTPIIATAGHAPEEFFVTTNSSTSEPFVYRVSEAGEKTLVDEEYSFKANSAS